MNPRTRRAALYAIGAIAILASANALAHSYAGLYDWAVHHRLRGWQAMSWPAEIDVFLAVGELALYVAYLDGWPARQRIWPWLTALTGLAVSVAGNVGHVQQAPGQPVIAADRLTAAASPLAAFAGLAIGLLVLKMTRQPSPVCISAARIAPAHVLAPAGSLADVGRWLRRGDRPAWHASRRPDAPASGEGSVPDRAVLRAASVIVQDAAARGERLSQRGLARRLRDDGHRFPNEHLRVISQSAAKTCPDAA